MRLNTRTTGQLPENVARYSYDRDDQSIGIVHFGIGAFHRAHMAWYTDLAMSAGERDWLISGVSMRSRSVADQLNPQDCLYTLTERSGDNASTRLIGSVAEVLFAPEQAEEVVSRIADPACKIVSFTVTEKGYARAESNQLDFELAQASFYPLLARGFELRKQAGLPGITLLCCDNLADNGRVLETMMRQWLEAEKPDLVGWFAEHCQVPSTMIDRIVPRTGEDDHAYLEATIGMEDAGAVFTESFSHWVIEDNFAGPRPTWENHGVQIVDDVAPYETAKLRMLNGAHSLLAYCGLRAGHEFVHEAVVDPQLRSMADRLMREEAMATIIPAGGQDLSAYADELLSRFADPALRHRLSQIAMDGTQKIPQRWLDTASALMAKERPARAIAAGFDAWLWHLEGSRFVDDPHGAELATLARESGMSAVIERCFDQSRGAPALWPQYSHLAGYLSASLSSA